MDFITTGIISSAAYDIFKKGLKISADNLKPFLSKWIVDDELVKRLASEIEQMNLSGDDSEKKIQRYIGESEQVQSTIKSINNSAQSNTTINQIHNGTGDNIGGHKIGN